MRWKALLLVVLILGAVGFLLTTDTGQKYAQFLRKKAGEFISVIFKGPQAGESFKILLKTSKEAFYGQSYSLANSDFSCSGLYTLIKVGELEIEKKEERTIDLSIKRIGGLAEYTKEGSIKLSGSSSYIEIDEKIYSSTKPFRIELEVVPLEFSLTNLQQEKISLPSVSGEIKRFYDEKVDSVSLTNSKLEINNFKGELKLGKDGAELEGLSNLVVGEKFTFT